MFGLGFGLGLLLRYFHRSASVIVKLKNVGETAYRADEYGRSIIVERHFSRAGTSGFKLKNANGKIMSTRKGDLDEIIEYFALQMDNPMNVLSQDNARQFLGNSSPAEKYKHFVKGVQLEQLDQDYRTVEDIIDGIEAALTQRMDELQDVEKWKNECAAQLAKSDRTRSMRENWRHLQRQMAWAQVEEQEAVS